MGLETGTYIDDLVITNPVGSTDAKSEGDNHLRLIKATIKATFPGLAGRANRIQVKAGNYNLAATDNMTVLAVTGVDKTVSLADAATIGNGFTVIVYAYGGNTVLDAAGADQINGEATLTLPQGWVTQLFCDAAGWTAFSVPVATGADLVQSFKDLLGVAQGIQICALQDGNQLTAMTTGQNKDVLEFFPGCELVAIWAGLKTGSSSGNVVMDVHADGTTIMATNKLTIVSGQTKTSAGGATPPALTTTTIPHGTKMSLDYDSVGTGAIGPVVYMALILDESQYA